MRRHERLELLYEALTKMQEAASLIRQAIEGSGHEANLNAYVVEHLEEVTENSNPYNQSVQSIINQIEGDPLEYEWFDSQEEQDAYYEQEHDQK